MALGIDGARRAAAGAHIDGAVEIDGGRGRQRHLVRIGGREDGHAGNGAEGGEVFERLLSDWFERLAGAISSDQQHGIDKVELVLKAGFDFFADNPDYVRLVRREALDGGAHLGIDLAAVLRPMWDRSVAYFQREMDQGTFRRHDPQQLLLTGYGALLSYFSDAPFLGGLLDVDPLDPAALELRKVHITSFYRMALSP
jgi:AcrR family transcriptional regulator